MLITEKYRDKISSVITCYDRIIIQGIIPGWSYAEGMTSYLNANKIKIFDYAAFSQPMTQKVRENAEKIAKENNIEIEFIRKLHAFRKDDRIKEIIEESGKTDGLIHIFSAMESCNTYKPWHDKVSKKTFLKPDKSKCLHYYFYFIDKELGLCYLRVPTWSPFRLQFYMNGHNFLANKMKKKDISYETIDNAFSYVSDQNMAQKLSDRINPEDIHKALDAFAKRYCPIVNELDLNYTWTIMQIECSTDIIFKSPEYLQPLYDEIIKKAIFTVKPDNIATFLGRKITYNFKKEVGTNYNQRFLGTRIKHHMGDVSIKMYDKHGIILRIESTCNDVSAFRVKRNVEHKDGTTTQQKAPMKKSIYSLYQLFTIMKAANYRYLEFVSDFDDHSSGDKQLDKLSKPISQNERSYRGFNFFDERDLSVFEVIGRGEFMTYGMQNKDIRQHLHNLSSSAVSRIFKRLTLHGLIEKEPGSYKYFPTSLGKVVILTSIKIYRILCTNHPLYDKIDMRGSDFMKESKKEIRNRQTTENNNTLKVMTVIINFLQLFIPITIAKRLVGMILITVGVSNSEITELTGLCDKSVRTLRKSMKEENIEDLLKIKEGSGRKSKTNGIEKQIIEEIEKNNYHTRQQIADMIEEKFNIHVSVYTVGRILKKTESKD